MWTNVFVGDMIRHKQTGEVGIVLRRCLADELEDYWSRGTDKYAYEVKFTNPVSRRTWVERDLIEVIYPTD